MKYCKLWCIIIKKEHLFGDCMEKIILHCDLNNFFASATLTQNPTLKPFPVAVCGDSEKRHGIVLAKNNIAKGFGVKTAETIWEAKRKCPNLITLKPDFNLYETLSQKARKIYMDFSDKVEPFGIDECWVDISNRGIDFIKGEEIAHIIRNRIKKELGVTVSVGVSFTKTFAKLGSDMKKPDAVTVITPQNFKEKVWPLSASELLMVGKATEKALRTMGIFTIGDIAKSDRTAIEKKLGKNGISLRDAANGVEKSTVLPFTNRGKPKSVSNSATAEQDLTNINQVFTAFLEFSECIAAKLKEEGLLAKQVGIQTTTFDFETKMYQAPLETPTDLAFIIAKAALSLFEENCNFDKPFRAVGVRALQLTDKNTPATQMNLFEENDNSKLKIIEENMLDLREKYGKDAIKRAACLSNKARSSSPGFYKR